MEVIELPVNTIQAPFWNPNAMDEAMVSHLSCSIQLYGLLVPLVVRALDNGSYETIGGAQRLAVIISLGFKLAPCVVVSANDSDARLLSQALNRIQGEDDLGLRAELIRKVLQDLPEGRVLSLLPESTHSLNALASLGLESIADHLQAWDKAQAAKLKHFQFQLLPSQIEVVQEALERILPVAKETQGDSPNARGTALFLLCRSFLDREDEHI